MLAPLAVMLNAVNEPPTQTVWVDVDGEAEIAGKAFTVINPDTPLVTAGVQAPLTTQ